MTYIQDSTATPAALQAGLDAPTFQGAKPITPGEVKRRWEMGVKACRKLIGHYRENVAFDAGDQWVFWTKDTNILQDVPRSNSRVRATANRMIAARRTVMAKLGRRPLIFEVVPGAPDDASVIAANLAENVIGAVARAHDWESIRLKSNLSAWLGGTAILHTEWDPMAGQPLGRLDNGLPYGTGDVRVSSSAINQVAFPPGCRDARTAQWFIKASVMPTEEAKDRYRLDTEPSSDANADTDTSRATAAAEPTGTATQEKSCMVYTYTERPSANGPGRICTVIGNKIVADSEWYYPWTDHLPVAVIKESPIEDHWAGMTVVSAGIQIQSLLNLALSGQLEHTKLAGNARLMMSSRSLELTEQLTDAVAEIIPVDPGDGIEPKWISPPVLPNWMTEQVAMLQRQLDDILGHQEISRGATPENIQSGVGLSILAEQADTPLTSLAVHSGRAWGYVASDALKLLEKFVIEPRQARIDAEGMRSWQITWIGRDLMGQTEATVPAEAVTPRSRAAMQAMAVRLWELGITKDPKLVARLGDFPDKNDFLEALDPDYAKAERENHDLAVGQTPVAAPFDNHAAHIECHNRFRKTLRYEQLPMQYRNNVDEHVASHEVEARNEAAQQAMQPPQMSGVPQANQPVGSAGGPEVPGGYQVPSPDQQPPAPASPLDAGGTGTPPNPDASAAAFNPTEPPQGVSL